MLTASASLDEQMGGPSRPLENLQNTRRTLYGTVSRRELNQMLRIHDFPEPTGHSPHRQPTITPLQQLFVLNSPFIQQQAALFVRNRLTESADSSRITQCYQRLFSRPPSAEELELGLRFVAEANDAEPTSCWVDYVQSLMGLNEFFFLD